jgi:hypothetical protein
MNSSTAWIVEQPLSVGARGLVKMGVAVHLWTPDEVEHVPLVGAKIVRNAVYYWPPYRSWPEPGLSGNFALNGHHATVARALGLEVTPIYVQQRGPGTISLDDSVKMAEWLKMCKDATAFYKRTGVARYYGILNEPGFGAGPHFNGSDYGVLFKQTAAAIKSVDSNAWCMGPELTGAYSHSFRGGIPWIRLFLAVPGVLNHLDVFSHHAYYKQTPERSFLEDTLATMRLVDGISGRRGRYAMTEGGYTNGTSVPAGTNEADMFDSADNIADKYSRWPFLHRGAGYEFCTYYMLRQQSTDTVGGENNFGLLTSTWGDRPWTPVIRDVFRHVHEADGAANYRRGTSWFTRLDAGSGQRLAAWSPGGANDAVWVVADRAGTLTVDTMGGGSSQFRIAEGQQRIKVTLGPRAQVFHSSTCVVRFPEFS